MKDSFKYIAKRFWEEKESIYMWSFRGCAFQRSNSTDSEKEDNKPYYSVKERENNNRVNNI